MISETTWSVYLLTSSTRTYIGSTTDAHRRLRQHNGEIRGGARSTRGRRWKLEADVGGFENRSVACRWERILKCRTRGLANRKSAMIGLMTGKCPPGKKHYDVPEGLILTIHVSMEVRYE